MAHGMPNPKGVPRFGLLRCTDRTEEARPEDGQREPCQKGWQAQSGLAVLQSVLLGGPRAGGGEPRDGLQVRGGGRGEQRVRGCCARGCHRWLEGSGSNERAGRGG
eukprot:9496014-Alexandrium_andersonii.AAC.1